MTDVRRVAYKSPEWWALRSTHVGGSDLGAIIGCSPWQTRDELLAQKLAGATTPETEAMRRGTRMESGVLAMMAEALGSTPWMTRFEVDTLVDPRGYLASVDGMLLRPRPDEPPLLLEAKTTNVRTASDGWGRPSPDEYRPERVPDGYLAQVQWGLMLHDLPIGYLGCLAAATDLSDDGGGARQPRLTFALYRIDADPVLQAYLTREADAFLADLALARKDAA